MKKLNKKQKDHIKSIFFKGLHVICYILSALFIVLCVIVGANSCQQRKASGVSAESLSDGNNYNYIYKVPVNSTGAFSLSVMQTLNDNVGLSNNNVYGNKPLGASESYTYVLPLGSQVYDSSARDFYNIDKITFVYEVEQYANLLQYYWRLYSIDAYDGGTSYTIGEKYNNDASSYDYYCYDYNMILGDSTILSLPNISDLFYQDEVSQFVFNKAFNYNAPMGLSADSPYGSGGSWTSSTNDTAYIDYNVGYFISNNQVFNSIRVYYFNGASMYFKIMQSDGTFKISQGAALSWSYAFMYYINTDTNTMIAVNYRNQVSFQPSSTTYAYYQDNSSTWAVDDYRQVKFLQYLSDSTKNSINAFNNNNQTAYTGTMVSGDINNIFSLIASAFTSWLPILSMTILPSITIGTLLFIPLVAMLVFAIIRVIKK